MVSGNRPKNFHPHPKFVDLLTTTLCGCDGGNPGADIWICGLEWGKSEKWNAYIQQQYCSKTYFEFGHKRIKIPCHTPTFTVDPGETKYFLNDGYETVVGNLLFRLTGNKDEATELRDFRLKRQYTEKGEAFKLNLFPIPCDSFEGEKSWESPQIDFTGITSKELYQWYCSERRFPIFRAMVEEYGPKIVICTGKTAKSFFWQAFIGSTNQLVAYKTADINHAYNNPAAEIFILKNGTVLVVIPFLTGRYGLSSHARQAGLHKLIGQILHNSGSSA